MKKGKADKAAEDALADLQQVCRQARRGIVRDAALLQRVYERSQKVREQSKKRFGIQDIGADIIREIRTTE